MYKYIFILLLVFPQLRSIDDISKKCFFGDNLPNTSQDFPRMQNSQELIISCGVMKVRRFLVDKKRVWHPNELNVLRSDDQFFEARAAFER